MSISAPKYPVSVFTPSVIHSERWEARRTLVRLRALQSVVGRTQFAMLRLSLRDFIEITAESRDAVVQRALVLRLKAGLPKRSVRQCQGLLQELASRKAVALESLEADLRSGIGTRPSQQRDLGQLRLA